jgi:ribonucleoside-diphosphate reductase alpha chain
MKVYHIDYQLNIIKIFIIKLKNLLYIKKKKEKLQNIIYKYHSNKIYINNIEINDILNNYKIKEKNDFLNYNNIHAIINILKKDKKLALSGYYSLMKENIISYKKFLEIQQRLYIVKIEKDSETSNYIDIEVDKNNNFYSGNFGLINIHNCGCGIDISTLRPKNAIVSNAAGTTTGAVSFMERFSNTTREVGQQNRRGALMISLDVRHPDVEDFITIKNDLTKVTGANISIKITDDFMNAVLNNEKYTLRFPVNSSIENAKNIKEIDALELWNKIVKSAHLTGEPGIIMWDHQHWYSTSSVYPGWYNISTNPCSEIGMNNDSCRLIAINYFNFVKNPYTVQAEFDYEKLYEVTYEAQRLMDDLVDLELTSVSKILEKIYSDNEPDYIKQIEIDTWKTLYDNGKKGRRTGLGFTALGDTLAALGIKYGSEESISIIDKISRIKFEAEFDSSIDMSIERGKFEDFDPNIENTSHLINMMEKEFPKLYERMMKFGRRNISLSTIAPTGSLSILTQTTSGIEPLFQIGYKRRRKVNPNEKDVNITFIDEKGDSWEEYDVFHPRVKQWMDVNNITDTEIAYTNSPYSNATANDIDWIKRIEIQSVLQKYVTHSISSTINLPNDVSTEKVSDIYIEAWKQGLKGVTVYRDGSRSGVLVSNKEEKKDIKQIIKENNAPKRPKILNCEIIRFMNSGERWIGFIGLYENEDKTLKPYEIFTGLAESFEIPTYVESGKIIKVKGIDGEATRYDFEYIDKEGFKTVKEGLNRGFKPEYWNIAKMVSALLRHNIHIPSIIHLIDSLHMDGEHVSTWKSGVKRMLKKYVIDNTPSSDKKCSECGQDTIVFENGCFICKNCGNTKC